MHCIAADGVRRILLYEIAVNLAMPANLPNAPLAPFGIGKDQRHHSKPSGHSRCVSIFRKSMWDLFLRHKLT